MSTRQLSRFSVMRALVKREFQEHRALFLYLPLVVSLLMALQFTATAVSSYVNDDFLYPFHTLPKPEPAYAASRGIIVVEGDGTVVQFAAQPKFFRAIILQVIYSPYALPNAQLLTVLYWGVMSFYFLMTMYQQRKNRSILFWNSMPVSDAETIVSKLLAGLIGSQAVFLGCQFFLHVFIFLGMLVYGSFYQIDVWQTFVEPFNVFSSDLELLGHSVLTMFWTLPVYAWLLLASAGSRSMPFAWAAGPLVIIAGMELLLTQTTVIAETVLSHVLPLVYFARNQMSAGKLPYLELALSTVLGLALVYSAIRFNRSEDV